MRNLNHYYNSYFICIFAISMKSRFSILLLLLFAFPFVSMSQKIIEYSAGMGSRNADDPDVWILYDGVVASHEGMVLHADSAMLNTVDNDFTAYQNVRIDLSDTSFIYGDQLYYDGNARIVDIWDDTVIFIDGETVLKTPHLMFDRNTNVATYTTWGHSVKNDCTLDSREGTYNSDTKIFNIYRNVVLQDSASRLLTDTLIYNTVTEVVDFVSPTHIFSDSTVLYSEQGSYDTKSRYAYSTKASQVQTEEKILTCDTLHYFVNTKYGKAFGNVRLRDTVNDVVCMGRYGETDQQRMLSFVTDSAVVVYVYEGDTVFMHADSLLVANDTSHRLKSIIAHHHVKSYRTDIQTMCDSSFFSVPDSLIQLFYDPVVWYESYQCTSDTIDIFHGDHGVRRVDLKSNSLTIAIVDTLKYNQLKGKKSVVYFTDEGEPSYADILGNAQMVYYLTEEDSLHNQSLIGVNAGVGSDMRIYFKDRKPDRLVTYGSPEMQAFPIDKFPLDQQRLPGFRWLDKRRPKSRMEIFMW